MQAQECEGGMMCESTIVRRTKWSIVVIPSMNALLLCTDMPNYGSLGTTIMQDVDSKSEHSDLSIAKGNLEAKF